VIAQPGVSNLERSIKFYEGALDMRVKERRDDLKFAHVETAVPGLEIGLSESPAPSGSGSEVLNLGVADVASARAARAARRQIPEADAGDPGKVALADFTDPDGNRLRLAAPPPPQ
jgi:catechol 2,3-dioxygenase-like lactoylglutathione lyase family enzyme